MTAKVAGFWSHVSTGLMVGRSASVALASACVLLFLVTGVQPAVSQLGLPVPTPSLPSLPVPVPSPVVPTPPVPLPPLPTLPVPLPTILPLPSPVPTTTTPALPTSAAPVPTASPPLLPSLPPTLPSHAIADNITKAAQTLDAPTGPLQSAGMLFWATSLENKPGLNDPQSLGIGVALASPAAATVSVRGQCGGPPTLLFSGPVPPAGKLFTVPGYVMQGQGVSSCGVYQVQSTAPIYAWQFNPLSNIQTNDATSLIPQQSLTTDYIVTTAPGDLLPAFITVVATATPTDVTVDYPATQVATGALGGLTPTTPVHYQLAAWEALNLRSSNGGDLTGAHITATGPIAVFAGDVCTRVGHGACDMLAEQVTPSNAWASTYPVCLPALPSGDVTVRLVSHAAVPTTVTTTPATGDVTLAPFGWQDVRLTNSTLFQGDHPFSLTLIAGGDPSADHSGDPSFVQIQPTSWFAGRGHYYLPTGYAHASLVVPFTSLSPRPVWLMDGAFATTAQTEIKGTDYHCMTTSAPTGAHTYESFDQTLMGGQVYAWDTYSLMAYEATLETNTTAPPAPGLVPPVAAVAARNLPIQNPASDAPCNPGLAWPSSNPVGPAGPTILDFTSDASLFASPYYVGGSGAGHDPAVIHIPGCLQVFIQVTGITLHVDFSDMRYYSTVALTAADITTHKIPADCTVKGFVYCVHDLAGGSVHIRDYYPGHDVAMLSATNGTVYFEQTAAPAMQGSLGQVNKEAYVIMAGNTWYGIDATTVLHDGGHVLVQGSSLHTQSSWCMAPLTQSLPHVQAPAMTPLPGATPYGSTHGTVDGVLFPSTGLMAPAWLGESIDSLASADAQALQMAKDRVGTGYVHEADAGLDYILFDLYNGSHLQTDASQLSGAFIDVRTNQSRLDTSGSLYSCSGWGIVSDNSTVASFSTKFEETDGPYKLLGAIDQTQTYPNVAAATADVSFTFNSPVPAKGFLSVCDIFTGTHPAVAISDQPVTLWGANFADGFPAHASTSIHDAVLYGGIQHVVPVPDNVLLNGAIHDPSALGHGNCLGGPEPPTNPLPNVEVPPLLITNGLGVPTVPPPCNLHSIINSTCNEVPVIINTVLNQPVDDPCDTFTLNTFDAQEFQDHHMGCMQVTPPSPCGYFAPGLDGIHNNRPGSDPNGTQRDPNGNSDAGEIAKNPKNTNHTASDLTACGFCAPNEDHKVDANFVASNCLPADPACLAAWTFVMASQRTAAGVEAHDRDFVQCVRQPTVLNGTGHVSGPNHAPPEDGGGVSAAAAAAVAPAPCAFPIFCLTDGEGSQRFWVDPTLPPPGFPGGIPVPVMGVVNIPLVSPDLRSVHYLVLVPTDLSNVPVAGAKLGFYNFVIKPSAIQPSTLRSKENFGGYVPGQRSGGFGFSTDIMVPPTLPWSTVSVVVPPGSVHAGPASTPAPVQYLPDAGTLAYASMTATFRPMRMQYYWQDDSYGDGCISGVVPVTTPLAGSLGCVSLVNVNSLTACVAGTFDQPFQRIALDGIVSRAATSCGNSGDGTAGGSQVFDENNLHVKIEARNRNPHRTTVNLLLVNTTNENTLTSGFGDDVARLSVSYGSSGPGGASATMIAENVSRATYTLNTDGKLDHGMKLDYTSSPWTEPSNAAALGVPDIPTGTSPNLPLDAMTGQPIAMPATPQSQNVPATNDGAQAHIDRLGFYFESEDFSDVSNVSVSVGRVIGPISGFIQRNATVGGADLLFQQSEDQKVRASFDLHKLSGGPGPGPVFIDGTLKHLNSSFQLTAMTVNGTNGCFERRCVATSAPDETYFSVLAHNGYFANLNVRIPTDNKLNAHLASLASVEGWAGEHVEIDAATPDNAAAYPTPVLANATFNWGKASGDLALHDIHAKTTWTFTYDNSTQRGSLASQVNQTDPYRVYANLTTDTVDLHVHRIIVNTTSPATFSKWHANFVLANATWLAEFQMDSGVIAEYDLDGHFMIQGQPSTFHARGILLNHIKIAGNSAGDFDALVALPDDLSVYHGQDVPLDIGFFSDHAAVKADWRGVTGPKTLTASFRNATSHLDASFASPAQTQPYVLEATQLTFDTKSGSSKEYRDRWFAVPRVELVPDSSGESTFSVTGEFPENATDAASLSIDHGSIGNFTVNGHGLNLHTGNRTDTFDVEGALLQTLSFTLDPSGNLTAHAALPTAKSDLYNGRTIPLHVGFYNATTSVNASWTNVTGYKAITLALTNSSTSSLSAELDSQQADAFDLRADIQVQLKPNELPTHVNVTRIQVVPAGDGTSNLTVAATWQKGNITDAKGDTHPTTNWTADVQVVRGYIHHWRIDIANAGGLTGNLTGEYVTALHVAPQPGGMLIVYQIPKTPQQLDALIGFEDGHDTVSVLISHVVKPLNITIDVADTTQTDSSNNTFNCTPGGGSLFADMQYQEGDTEDHPSWTILYHHSENATVAAVDAGQGVITRLDAGYRNACTPHVPIVGDLNLALLLAFHLRNVQSMHLGYALAPNFANGDVHLDFLAPRDTTLFPATETGELHAILRVAQGVSVVLESGGLNQLNLTLSYFLSHSAPWVTANQSMQIDLDNNGYFGFYPRIGDGPVAQAFLDLGLPQIGVEHKSYTDVCVEPNPLGKFGVPSIPAGALFGKMGYGPYSVPGLLFTVVQPVAFFKGGWPSATMFFDGSPDAGHFVADPAWLSFISLLENPTFQNIGSINFHIGSYDDTHPHNNAGFGPRPVGCL